MHFLLFQSRVVNFCLFNLAGFFGGGVWFLKFFFVVVFFLLVASLNKFHRNSICEHT